MFSQLYLFHASKYEPTIISLYSRDLSRLPRSIPHQHDTRRNNCQSGLVLSREHYYTYVIIVHEPIDVFSTTGGRSAQRASHAIEIPQ